MDLTVIILTYNEEIHIRRALENVCPIAQKVLVIDSPSTDRTAEIVQEVQAVQKVQGGADVELIVHKYPGNQASQFNWALDNCKIDTEWILRLDADEYMTPELIEEMQEKLPTLEKDVNAVVLPLGRAFMGRVLKHGIVNGVKMIRLFRYGKVRYEQRLMDEHLKVLEGGTITFNGKFIDDNRMTIRAFTDKHNNYSSREAAVLLDAEYGLNDNSIDAEDTELAAEVAAKRAQKAKYAKMPLFWRAFGYFIYRYIVKMGFLDGKEGFCWDFFQGLWYRMLVDAKVSEVKRACGNDKAKIMRYIKDNFGVDLNPEANRSGGVILRFKFRDCSLELRDYAGYRKEGRMAA